MLAPVLASLLASGCLIPEAPEYGPPQKTPIFIIDDSVDPSPRSLVSLSTSDADKPFRFEIRSEDAGEGLMAALFADYKHTNGTWLDYRPYEPKTFDETLTISFYMSPTDGRLDPAPHCHSVTLLVLHTSGWDFDKKQPKGAPADLASVTWMVSIADAGGVEPALSTCPDGADEVSDPTDPR